VRHDVGKVLAGGAAQDAVTDGTRAVVGGLAELHDGGDGVVLERIGGDGPRVGAPLLAATAAAATAARRRQLAKQAGAAAAAAVRGVMG